MIKILFFIPGLSEGGAEKVLCNLVNNMDQTKFDITVQTIYECDYNKYLKPTIRYKSIFKCKKKLIKKISNLWYRFCTELKLTYTLYIKGDYDIEVAYLECGATKVMAASTNKKAKKLAWVHCDIKKKGLTDKKTAGYYTKFDKAICVSEDVKTSFDKIYGKCVESTILKNVLDEDEILEKSKENMEWDADEDCIKLVAIGRLTEQKNFDYLIDTCGKLKKSGKKISLKILGNGPLYDQLNSQIISNNLEKEVELMGYKDNPYPYIRMSDYVVCSSKYEGLSTVVQEALILEKIVVTTPCTGMKELLGNSEYGLIVDNREDGLYNGLIRMMDDVELKQKITMRIRENKHNFSKKKTIETTELFFENIIR